MIVLTILIIILIRYMLNVLTYCNQLTINFKDCDAGNYVTSVPTRMYCALHYDAVLNIADNGIQLLD